MLAYQLPPPRDPTQLRRRASGLGLALGANLLLLLVLLGLGKLTPGVQKPSSALIVDLVRNSERAAAPAKTEAQRRPTPPAQSKPLLKPPPIVLPAKPTIKAAPKSSPWIEMSKDELAAADIANLPKSSRGDSEEVGRAPNGDVLYAAEWAREPTDTELGNYLPANSPDGYGLVACKTLPENRVDDCVELENYPAGSHLARAVRLAAWQFRVRPPRKNGRTLVGSWVRIRIDYEHYSRGGDR